MKLLIPRVGDKFKLLENWNCTIESEYRNSKIFDALGIVKDSDIKGTAISITLPKDTVLRMDRLYVRAPASNYDSITFTIEESPLPGLEKARFWVKITEANNMECERFYQDKTKIKKFSELFNLIANELSIDTQHLNDSDTSNVLNEIVKNEAKYTLNMRIPTIALEYHLANFYGRQYWNGNAYASSSFEHELMQVQKFFKENGFPQYLDVKIDFHYILGNIIHKNQNNDNWYTLQYMELINQYNNTKNEKGFSYRINLSLFNKDWKAIDVKKDGFGYFEFFGPNNLHFVKSKAPQETLESWNTYIENESGEKEEITDSQQLLKTIVKWDKENKKVKNGSVVKNKKRNP